MLPHGEWPLPRLGALEQAGRVSHSREEMTWHCSVCGVVPPLMIAGSYVRRPCACQRAAREEQRGVEQRRELAHNRHQHAYCWLGRQWAEAGLREKCFETFEEEMQPEARRGVLAWAHQPKGVLLLSGSYGTGKTHLLAAIANARCLLGSGCLFASTVSLFDAIGQRIGQHRDYHGLIAQAIGTPLLLLDDVDKLKPSEFREETLYKIINGRYTAGRPLALSSNCEPAELVSWIGAAAFSRLMQQIVIFQLSGEDYRVLLGTEEHTRSLDALIEK